MFSPLMMASLKHEFHDFLPHGEANVPMSFSLFKFAAARSHEIAALTQAIDEPVRTGQVFQHLPKHMRRRVMSHTVKRMPVKLREAHRRLMEKSGCVEGSESKRPSRKHRRRPRNLLKEYNRRQRSAIWLETHIWHAKRFHMANKWGYKLAVFPNDKSFRACYRASANHCLIQDISYYMCIELHGRLDDLLSGLQRHTSIYCGLTFAAKCMLDGSREGSVIMFKAGMYPRGVIGSTRFLWRPAVEKIDERTIWIWVHPSCYSDVVEEFVGTFQLEEIMGTMAAEEIDNNSAKNVESMKIELRNVPFNRTPNYKSRRGCVVMVLLKDTLNRFRLTGPLSQSCLSAAFRVAVMSDKDCLTDGEPEMHYDDVSMAIDQANGWWKEFYGRKGHSRLVSLHQQANLWHQLSSAAITPAQLPPHMVLPLTIVDPRLEMPAHRSKAIIASSAMPAIAQLPPLVAGTNPLWDPYMRDAVSQGKLSSASLDALRAQQLVPGYAIGSTLLPSERLIRLPVLLIQRPGNQTAGKRLGYGSGWDVVMPCGWGMPVWLGLVYRGARAGGLREAESVAQEAELAAELPPDSAPGRVLRQDRASELRKKHFRLPPDKRPNYIKLGIVTPFHAPWEILTRDWSKAAIDDLDVDDDCGSFYVLRDSLKLRWLAALVCGKNVKSMSVEFSVDERHHCLVPVGILVKGRGVLETNAHICMPSFEDLRLFRNDATYRGPEEPIHMDCNETERKKSRMAHMQLLKRLRRKRVRTKRNLEKHGNKLSCEQEEKKKKKKRCPKPTEHIVREQSDKMQRLWLPENVATIKDSASRSIMGFLVSGDFRFTEACSAGQGYVTLSALLEYIKNSSVWKEELSVQPVVLLRTVSSFQYSFADLRILTL